MKTLYIMRHAKSSWDHSGLEDHQRPLLEKGKKRTRYVVNFLQEQETRIDLILSSHAERAYETAKIIAHGLHYPEEKIVISKKLYFGNQDSYFDVFFDLSNEVNSLMMVGHNPGFTSFANFFLDRKIDYLPTSGIVCITFEMDAWDKIHDSKRKTKFVISPKLLQERLGRNKN